MRFQNERSSMHQDDELKVHPAVAIDYDADGASRCLELNIDIVGNAATE